MSHGETRFLLSLINVHGFYTNRHDNKQSLSDKEDKKTPFAVYYQCGLPTAKEKQQKEDIQNGTE